MRDQSPKGRTKPNARPGAKPGPTKPGTTQPGAKPGTTHEQRARRARFERARRESLRPENLSVLYGWQLRPCGSYVRPVLLNCCLLLTARIGPNSSSIDPLADEIDLEVLNDELFFDIFRNIFTGRKAGQFTCHQ